MDGTTVGVCNAFFVGWGRREDVGLRYAKKAVIGKRTEKQKPALRAGFGSEKEFYYIPTSRMTSMNLTSKKGQRVTYGA